MRTLFIDFDGTICHDTFWRSLPRNEYNQVQQVLFEKNSDLVDKWVRGKHSSEEINQYLAEHTGISYKSLWELFVEDCKSMHVTSDVLGIIAELKQNFHTVLITGNMDCFNRFTVPALQLDNYFHKIVNSYNEGQLKGDKEGESFKKYVKGNINQAVLIEDNEFNCEIFTRLGGLARKVTQEKTASFWLKLLLK